MDFRECLRKNIPDLTDAQYIAFERYYELLTERNKVMNLTTITEPEEVVTKHFADSILTKDLIPQGAECIDIGTGAGFPGIPLLIVRPDIKMCLLDSLQKRIGFLDEVCEKLGITAVTVHARCEDAGHDVKLRAKFDIALTRAVAATNVLLEWTIPFVKKGGISLMYKSASAVDELKLCESAQKKLRCEIKTVGFDVPWGERCVVIAEKVGETDKVFPRKAGTAKKNPL